MFVERQRSGTARTRDGISLHYTVYGEGGPEDARVVLVHSLAMAGSVWEWVANRLAGHGTVLTYDCRGHGASTRAPGPYRLETFAHDLADLLDSMNWNSVNLAGASMGGNVSLQFAQLYPERVRSLGLVDTTAWYGADAPQKWADRARKAEEQGLAALLDFQESRWFTEAFRSTNGEGVVRCRSLFLANDVSCFVATCHMLGAFDLRAGLSAMRMPTAIIVGEEDYATPPAMARELHQGIPGSTLQVIPKARHLTFVEKPDVVAEALTALHNPVSSS
jgi:3-oxoadipate enol-lactonase